LRSEMTRVQGLTGAALLGDGRIALVLDTVGLGPVLERLRARAMA
jgi:chemotaxis protein histidine kinase CheA